MFNSDYEYNRFFLQGYWQESKAIDLECLYVMEVNYRVHM